MQKVILHMSQIKNTGSVVKLWAEPHGLTENFESWATHRHRMVRGVPKSAVDLTEPNCDSTDMDGTVAFII